jgi:hypothetical protein
MHSIYKKADKVVAWLGPRMNDSEVVFKMLNRLAAAAAGHMLHHTVRVGPEYVLNALREEDMTFHVIVKTPGFKDLAQCSYWNRTWVVQELAANVRKVVMQCGSEKFLLSNACSMLEEKHYLDHSTGPEGVVGSADTITRIRNFRI